MPSMPATFAISCGSAITAVVPWGKTVLANPTGVAIELSI
ncbi:MAG: hypothetical protein BWY62_01436 [Firmicutes bacterium ADurb.Bin356]|nr:MAG: hypothetical protein BWY62_01436 [Firmicutes bacterium ADurb.Bin356]